jgi:hypothetical protein
VQPATQQCQRNRKRLSVHDIKLKSKTIVHYVKPKMSRFVMTKSRCTSKTLAAFITGGVDAPLKSVPGLGEASIEKLEKAGVTTTLQLLGVFLSGYSQGTTLQQVCDRFWDFLTHAGTPSSHRSTCIHAMLEKTSVFFPECFPTDAMETIREDPMNTD